MKRLSIIGKQINMYYSKRGCQMFWDSS